MKRCAVTGTNGKTSTAIMTCAALEAAGLPTALLCGLGASRRLEPWTDLPEGASVEAAEGLARRDGAAVLVQELTSRALASGWRSHAEDAVAIYTNLAIDHLDVHGDATRYAAAKASLFEALRPGACAVLNADDPAHVALAQRLDPYVRLRWFGSSADPREGVRLRSTQVTPSGSALVLEIGARTHSIKLPLFGLPFGLDAAAAAAAALELGAPVDAIAAGLEAVPSIPGRFEVIADAPLVVVDFAHNEAALRGTLQTARALAGARVLVVFGAGGDRMRAKRAAMGAVAASLADRAWITSDNPRSEAPAVIVSAIVEGWRSVRDEHPDVELHRPSAIAAALEAARPDDVLILAGMGPDAYRPSPDEAETTDADVVSNWCD